MFELGDTYIIDEDESRFTGPNAPQILKCVPSGQLASTTVQHPMKDVVECLLNALIVKYSWNTEEGMFCIFDTMSIFVIRNATSQQTKYILF